MVPLFVKCLSQPLTPMLAEGKTLPPPQRMLNEIMSAKNDLSVVGKSCQHSPNELAFGIRMQGLESLTHDTGIGLLGTIPDRETELTRIFEERVNLQSIARSVFHRVDASRRLKEALAAQIPRDQEEIKYGDQVMLSTEASQTLARAGPKGPFTVRGGNSRGLFLEGVGQLRLANRLDVTKLSFPDMDPPAHTDPLDVHLLVDPEAEGPAPPAMRPEQWEMDASRTRGMAPGEAPVVLEYRPLVHSAPRHVTAPVRPVEPHPTEDEE